VHAPIGTGMGSARLRELKGGSATVLDVQASDCEARQGGHNTPGTSGLEDEDGLVGPELVKRLAALVSNRK
jgi:hypothetical protein